MSHNIRPASVSNLDSKPPEKVETDKFVSTFANFFQVLQITHWHRGLPLLHILNFGQGDNWQCALCASCPNGAILAVIASHEQSAQIGLAPILCHKYQLAPWSQRVEKIADRGKG